MEKARIFSIRLSWRAFCSKATSTSSLKGAGAVGSAFACRVMIVFLALAKMDKRITCRARRRDFQQTEHDKCGSS